MHSADRRSRLRSDDSPTARFDASSGRVTLSGSFAAPETLTRLRRTLESALYSETHRITVDLSGVTLLDPRALRELEVARCLGNDMGRELHLIAPPGSAAANVLARAHMRVAHLRRRPH